MKFIASIIAALALCGAPLAAQTPDAPPSDNSGFEARERPEGRKGHREGKKDKNREGRKGKHGKNHRGKHGKKHRGGHGKKQRNDRGDRKIR